MRFGSGTLGGREIRWRAFRPITLLTRVIFPALHVTISPTSTEAPCERNRASLSVLSAS